MWGMSAARIRDLSLYLVADVDSAAGKDLVRIVKEAVSGGVTAVQLRAKSLDTSAFLELAVRIGKALRGKSVPLIINDRVDIAVAGRAAGVHLGQGDMAPDKARKVLGSKKIVGISVNTLEEALAAERLGADYVGLGPIFPTATKETGLPIIGPEGVRKVREAVTIPVVAIGGVNAANAAEIMQAGASGIAVVSAILGAADPRRAAADLKDAIARHRTPGPDAPPATGTT